MSVSTIAGQPVAAPSQGTDYSSARALIQGTLNGFGLGQLGDWAWGLYLKGESTDQIMLELEGTKAFADRFPAIAALKEQGRTITPGAYIDYERTYYGLLHQYGMPKGFYDSSKDVADALINGVKAPELETRLQLASSDQVGTPEMKAEIERLFPGQGAGHLGAIFMDPTQALPALEQKFAAAQIASQADLSKFGQLSTTQAVRLAQIGVTQSTAAQGFQQLAGLGDVAHADIAGLDKPSQDQLLAAQFAGDADATRLLQRRQAQLTGDFQGGTQYAGSSGSPGAGIGSAQNL